MHVPTRRAPRADLPTAWGGETPHLAARAPRADLPTAWGGETSPPGALGAPTSPLRGEAKPPHLAARAPRADLPTAWGGETSPPGCARSARRPPHCVGRRQPPTSPSRSVKAGGAAGGVV